MGPKQPMEALRKIGHASAWLSRAIVQAVFPCRCQACDTLLDPDALSRRQSLVTLPAGAWLCAACDSSLRPLSSPICCGCGISLNGDACADHLCQKCLTGHFAFQRARAWGAYDGSLKQLIRRFKYDGQLSAAPILGQLLDRVYQDHWSLSSIDMIVAVPLHRRRLRSRGFNQADLLVDEWLRTNRRQGFAPLPAPKRDVLTRMRAARPQTGLAYGQRQRNMRNAFQCPAPASVTDQRILLVDDVMTTGATADACAHALLKAGARAVDVLTVARVLPSNASHSD